MFKKVVSFFYIKKAKCFYPKLDVSVKQSKQKNVSLFFFTLLSFPFFASAAGLDDATQALTTIQNWLFPTIGIGALVYLGYNVAMALMERKDWGEVAVALGKTALAGGAMVGGTWALDVFK